MKKYKDVDSYINDFPKEVQTILKKLRATIKKEMPKGEQVISYGIPCFKLNGKYVVYFAAWKEYISMYPAFIENQTLAKQLAKYKKSKGTLKFPIDEPLPLTLISKFVKDRVRQVPAEKKK